MNAQEDIKTIRQIMMLTWEMSKELEKYGIDGCTLDSIMEPAEGKPFETLRIGFYEFTFNEESGFYADFVPGHHLDAWEMNVDLDQIESFLKPPIKRKEN